MKQNGEPGYRSNGAWMYSLMVVVGWGLVPYLAKAANYPGGFTTFWVNVFAALGVLVIMAWKGYLPQLGEVRLLPRFVAISIVWPLVYSISYFSIISASTGSLATMLNYLWPLFALMMLTRQMRVPKIGLVLAFAGFVLVAIIMWLEGNLALSATVMLFGLVTPLTQAYFNVATNDESKYPGSYAWFLTLVGALVTAVGSGIYILVFEGGEFTLGASLSDLIPLMIIGVGGNSVGFYAFLKAGQLSKTPSAKVWFILTMFLVPFVQVLFLVLGIEQGISPTRLLGIAVVALGFLVFKLWENRQRSQHQAAGD